MWEDQQLRTLERLMDAVWAENERQLDKWGVQIHTIAEWALITEEEVGETMQELCNLHFSHPEHGESMDELRKKVRAEAIQAATLFLKIAEMAEVTA